MNDESDARSTGTGPGHEDGGSHMSGGKHMSGGGHMAGGAHMSGGRQMAGSGPLSGGAADGSDSAAPASGGSGDEGTARSRPSGQRSTDVPGAEPMGPMAVSGAGLMSRLWPMLAVVVALLVGVIIGYAVWG